VTHSFVLIPLLFLAAEPGPARDRPVARIETVEGLTIEGKIVSIEPNGRLRIAARDRELELSLDELERVTLGPSERPAEGEPTNRSTALFLADGGRLSAILLAPRDGQQGTVLAEVGLGKSVSLSFEALTAMRFAGAIDPAAESELQARLADRQPDRDLLVVLREGRPIVLPGALEALGPSGWSFRFGKTLQSGPLDKAYGVVLGATSAAIPRRPATLTLRDGSILSVRIVSADDRTILVDAGALGDLMLPWNAVDSLDCRSERVVYLSDLEPVTAIQRSLLDTTWPWRRDASVSGGRLLLAGRAYSKGLGVHSYTALTYELDGTFERFRAVVGIDDGATPGGTAVFRVLADGQLVFESAPIGSQSPTNVSIDLVGVRTLVLECDSGDDLDLSDHGDWADARLIRAKPGAIR